MAPKRFNIRVYGIWIEAGRVLVSEETIKGKQYTKFPGGGLEPGEGIKNCLIREWKEELDMDIKVLEHFYTTDFFQRSYFDDSQVISIYYRVRPIHEEPYLLTKKPNEYMHWLKLEELTENSFSLPIDKVVGKMLMKKNQG